MEETLREAVLAALSPRRAPPPEAAARRAGLLYALDFDRPPPPAPPPPAPPPPPPSFDAAALDAARAEGFGRGRAEALAEEEQAQAALRLAALQAIGDALGASRDHAARLAEEAAEALAQAVLGLLLAALPATCARHGERELRALVRAVLPALSAEPRVAVRLHPQVHDAVQEELARLDPDLAARVSLLPAEALAPGDVSIAWADGSATRSARTLAAAARETLAPLGLLDLPDTTHATEMADAR